MQLVVFQRPDGLRVVMQARTPQPDGLAEGEELTPVGTAAIGFGMLSTELATSILREGYGVAGYEDDALLQMAMDLGPAHGGRARRQ